MYIYTGFQTKLKFSKCMLPSIRAAVKVANVRKMVKS